MLISLLIDASSFVHVLCTLHVHDVLRAEFAIPCPLALISRCPIICNVYIVCVLAYGGLISLIPLLPNFLVMISHVQVTSQLGLPPH